MPARNFAARIFLQLSWVALAAMTAGCAHETASARASADWRQAAQLVLITTPDWNADQGTMRAFERAGAGWKEIGLAQPVMIGRAGAAWGLGMHPTQTSGPKKSEGDGRSPAGMFKIGSAFGYSATVATGLAYQAMQAAHYCVDVSGSPLYNRIVDSSVVGKDAIAGSTEPMRRDLHAGGDQRYRLGFVIEHNVAARPMGGSCIFAHLWKSPGDATSGCTAMDPAIMDTLLAWLRADQEPVFVLLPEREYMRLRNAWRLPALGNQP